MGYYDWANHRQLVKQSRMMRLGQRADQAAARDAGRAAWAAMQAQPAAPGWYPDPNDAELLWFWDGQRWDGRSARITG